MTKGYALNPEAQSLSAFKKKEEKKMKKIKQEKG